MSELLDSTWYVMDICQSSEFVESMNEYATTHKEFQLKVITSQDKLHNLLDEFDWEAFTLKIKYEEGYTIFKHLVDGTSFHSTANVEWQRRLTMARTHAAKTALDTKKSKPRQTFPIKFGFHPSGSPAGQFRWQEHLRKPQQGSNQPWRRQLYRQS